jgi:hypothetical protein
MTKEKTGPISTIDPHPKKPHTHFFSILISIIMKSKSAVQLFSDHYTNTGELWAKKALMNALQSELNKSLSFHLNLYSAVYNCFEWHETPEGHDYWDEKHRELFLSDK